MILSLYRHIVFTNYSLGEGEVSRTAAVYSEDSLLFAVGNKVGFTGFVCRPCRVLEGGKEGLYLNTSRSKIELQ